MSDTKPEHQEAQITPRKMNPKTYTQVACKPQKIKDKEGKMHYSQMKKEQHHIQQVRAWKGREGDLFKEVRAEISDLNSELVTPPKERILTKPRKFLTRSPALENRLKVA
jgi:hypothetical protein